MHTEIHPSFAEHPRIAEAQAVIRACVHCGFCNATCPTYLELGDERDGPRGRIYLLKQLLETGNAGSRTQRHLDRCLTCRGCETTCPSGVEFGRLADIGRGILERRIARPPRQRLLRWLLKTVVPYPRRFGCLLGIARATRRLLPRRLRAQVPARPTRTPPRIRHDAGAAASTPYRRMLMPAGCVQQAATPRTRAAAARVLAKLGIAVAPAAQDGCCGALHYHLGDHAGGLDFARRNIDAWWPAISDGAEAIVMTASGCGTMVKDYGHLLSGDAAYAAKAARVSALAQDVGEVLAAEDWSRLGIEASSARIAWHCPCTLQHGQKQPRLVEDLLIRSGFRLTRSRDPQLCCGSAGSYSILQPRLSARLRDKKLAALMSDAPDLIATANVGCQLHLASAAEVPVRHWIELIDEGC